MVEDELLACSSMLLTADSGAPYWFRTLDYKTNIWENGAHLVSIPKGYEVSFIGQNREMISKYDVMGMTYNKKDEWLLDGINSNGLLGGLLFLYEGTSVELPDSNYTGIVGLEILTYLLVSCGSIEEICKAAATIQVLNIPIGTKSIPSTLHYIFIDERGKSVVLEAADAEHPGVFQIYAENQTGILTNSPIYPAQLENLSWFISQSPELQYGNGTSAITSIKIDDTVVAANEKAPHWCQTGTFPATYTSYDRFVRLALLKALNSNGKDFSEEQMLPKGLGIMRSVFEPHNQGIFHYVKMNENGELKGQGDGYTQYVIVYDMKNRILYLQPYDSIAWTKISLEKCSKREIQHHQVCRDAVAGTIEYIDEITR